MPTCPRPQNERGDCLTVSPPVTSPLRNTLAAGLLKQPPAPRRCLGAGAGTAAEPAGEEAKKEAKLILGQLAAPRHEHVVRSRRSASGAICPMRKQVRHRPAYRDSMKTSGKTHQAYGRLRHEHVVSTSARASVTRAIPSSASRLVTPSKLRRGAGGPAQAGAGASPTELLRHARRMARAVFRCVSTPTYTASAKT